MAETNELGGFIQSLRAGPERPEIVGSDWRKPPSSLDSAIRSTNSAPRSTPRYSKSARLVGSGLNVFDSCHSWPIAIRMVNTPKKRSPRNTRKTRKKKEESGIDRDGLRDVAR